MRLFRDLKEINNTLPIRKYLNSISFMDNFYYAFDKPLRLEDYIDLYIRMCKYFKKSLTLKDYKLINEVVDKLNEHTKGHFQARILHPIDSQENIQNNSEIITQELIIEGFGYETLSKILQARNKKYSSKVQIIQPMIHFKFNHLKKGLYRYEWRSLFKWRR